MRNIKLTFSCFRNLGRSAGGSGGRFLKQPQSGFVIEDLDLDHGGADDTVESTRIEPFLAENRVILDYLN